MLATNFSSSAELPSTQSLSFGSVVPPPAPDPLAEDRSDTSEQPVVPAQPPEQSGDGWVMDTVKAPLRGIAQAVGGVYNLAASLDHFVGDDTLTTWDVGATVGHSKTIPGSLVEGLSQFLVGFVPFAGWMKGFSALSTTVGAVTKLNFTGNTLASAAATFAVFDGQQAKLSNLINEKFPALKNPVTDFLAASPEDGEALGRFKNALEGAGLGAALDGLLVGVKAIKAGRLAKVQAAAAGKSTAEAAAEVNAAMAAEAHTENITQAVDELKGKAHPAMEATPSTDTSTSGGVTSETPPPKETIPQNAELHPRPDEGTLMAAVNKYRDTGELADVDTRFINIDNITSGDETRADMLEHIAKTVENNLAADKGPRVSDAKARNEAFTFFSEISGTKSDATIAFNLQKDVKSADGLYARVVAYRIYADALGKHVSSLIEGAISGTDTQRLKFLDAAHEYTSFIQDLSHLGTGVGRALRAHMKVSGADTLAFESAIGEALDSAGGRDAISAYARKLKAAMEGGGAEGGAKMLNKNLTLGGKFLAIHNEYWMNSILSGPATYVVNLLGNSFAALYLPAERAFGAYRSGDVSSTQAFMKMYGYMHEAFKESMDLAYRSIRDDGSALDKQAGTMETATSRGLGGKENTHAITAANFNQDNDSALGSLINHVGTVTRLPNRMLTGADEFFKQLNARAAAKSKLYVQAMADETLRSDPAAVGQFVNSKFKDLLDESGQLLSQAGVARTGAKMAAEQGITGFKAIEFVQKYTAQNYDRQKSNLLDFAKDYAQEATFTRPLPIGGIPYRIQQAAQDHPILRMVVPFIRTPVNILKFAGQRFGPNRMPLAGELHARFNADMISKDPMVRASAMGRQSLGQGLFVAAGVAGASGVITGGGPTDVNERKQLMATGWQPYSIKMPNGDFVSFQRLDPFSTFLGLAGDFSEAAHRAYEKDGADWSSLPALVGMATARNITNKSYLTGISQLVEALSDPERFLPKLIQKQAGSYVPNFVATTTQDFGNDPYLHEVRSVMEAMKKRVPGFSTDLDVQRNIVGEPVSAPHGRIPGLGQWTFGNPLTVSTLKHDPIFEEIDKLKSGLAAPRQVQSGIDLTEFKNSKNQSAYDRWQELTGQTRSQGKDLRGALGALLTSPAYQKLSDKTTVEYDSPRSQEVRRVINSYRYKALDAMLKEFPELNANWKQNFQNRAALQRGVSVNDLMPLPFPTN